MPASGDQENLSVGDYAADQDIKDKPRTVQINYRVKNLGEVLSHLKSKGVAIEKTAEDPSYGNFAWVRDPDGNKIERWEPSESQ